MSSRRSFLKSAALFPAVVRQALPAQAARRPLDPRGKIHIPIGIANTLDTLKTFVEAEGNFSPGVGSYGIYFWLLDLEADRLFAPTMDDVPTEHGLAPSGLLIPWSSWTAGDFIVRTEICQTELASPSGRVCVVGARVRVSNRGTQRRRAALYVALRPLGPAGWNVKRLEVDAVRGALLVDGHPAILADRKPSSAGVVSTDTISELALAGKLPAAKLASSDAGDCSGALRFDWTVAPHSSQRVGLICPVLAGRRAARHHWVDLRQNAMVDDAELNPQDGGIPQPDPGAAWFRTLRVERQFEQAEARWTAFLRGIEIQAPDPRWGESMRAILAHAAMCMNEGAPDVAVLNYNVFNRDGMYIANMMQKSGLAQHSELVLDYFIAHPFNGRAYPEADNPGQILWAIHQHWLLTRDREWLDRLYPAVRKLAAMIAYYRTTPPPHWVAMNSLDFGDSLPDSERRELKPGRCDGFHPEYTEAFDIAGLRGASDLAEASGQSQDGAAWHKLAESLFLQYDQRFAARLPRAYGSYAVLWPCRLYPIDREPARDQFRGLGAQPPKSWRYFPLATAHQGLLAGNREAGHGTLSIHLEHEQMRGWYAFDEGGGSGSGGWQRLRTTWTHSQERPGDNRSVAMPHGWALAEFWLLLRDSLAFEDADRLCLLAGVPEKWFRAPEGIRATGLATYFGTLDLAYRPVHGGAELRLSGSAAPPKGFVLRLPPGLNAAASSSRQPLPVEGNGDCALPPGSRTVQLRFP